MKGKYLGFLILPVFLLGIVFLSSVRVYAFEIEDDSEVVDDHKVNICHAKPPQTAKNGFNFLSIDKNSVFKRGHDIHLMDIIPSFEYTVKEKQISYEYADYKKNGKCPGGYEEYEGGEFDCRKEVTKKIEVKKFYEGSTVWKAEAGKIVLDNKCDLPELCEYTTEGTPGEWSEWMGADEDPLDGYRIRPIYAFDLIRYQLFEEEYACDTEERYDACDSTESKVSVSGWVEDASGEKEVQTTVTTLVDSTDETVICESNTETISRDIEEEEDDDDDGDVEGITDEVEPEEEVKGTTTVVLAETGASDNILVYIVQAVLMLSTLVSGTLFVKKYII